MFNESSRRVFFPYAGGGGQALRFSAGNGGFPKGGDVNGIAFAFSKSTGGNQTGGGISGMWSGQGIPLSGTNGLLGFGGDGFISLDNPGFFPGGGGGGGYFGGAGGVDSQSGAGGSSFYNSIYASLISTGRAISSADGFVSVTCIFFDEAGGRGKKKGKGKDEDKEDCDDKSKGPRNRKGSCKRKGLLLKMPKLNPGLAALIAAPLGLGALAGLAFLCKYKVSSSFTNEKSAPKVEKEGKEDLFARTQTYVDVCDESNGVEMKKHHNQKHSYSKVPIVHSTNLI